MISGNSILPKIRCTRKRIFYKKYGDFGKHIFIFLQNAPTALIFLFCRATMKTDKNRSKRKEALI